MHRALPRTLLTKLKYITTLCVMVACGNAWAQTEFSTPCQALVTLVDEQGSRKVKIETFELKIMPSDKERISLRVQGETHVEFFYAIPTSASTPPPMRGVRADIQANQWLFQYQHTALKKTSHGQLSLNPISGGLRYQQTNKQQQTVYADGLCELPLQGKEAFIQAHARNTPL
jgi:hypothetical protein